MPKPRVILVKADPPELHPLQTTILALIHRPLLDADYRRQGRPTAQVDKLGDKPVLHRTAGVLQYWCVHQIRKAKPNVPGPLVLGLLRCMPWGGYFLRRARDVKAGHESGYVKFPWVCKYQACPWCQARRLERDLTLLNGFLLNHGECRLRVYRMPLDPPNKDPSVPESKGPARANVLRVRRQLTYALRGQPGACQTHAMLVGEQRELVTRVLTPRDAWVRLNPPGELISETLLQPGDVTHAAHNQLADPLGWLLTYPWLTLLAYNELNHKTLPWVTSQ